MNNGIPRNNINIYAYNIINRLKFDSESYLEYLTDMVEMLNELTIEDLTEEEEQEIKKEIEQVGIEYDEVVQKKVEGKKKAKEGTNTSSRSSSSLPTIQEKVSQQRGKEKSE